MHDIWNPWHGCRKWSEGCDHCYMFFLDKSRGQDGSRIYRTQNFNYPLQKKRNGSYKIQSGEHIRVCLNADFFMEEADEWRDEAWSIMARRPDVRFSILTKRASRIADHLPKNWGSGWPNILLQVTCENQRRADERLPLLLEIPAQHKGTMCAPLLGPINIEKYLQSNQLELVLCGGENYDGARPCHYEWVKDLSQQCRRHNVTFNFVETGTTFVKDGKTYHLPKKSIQSLMAWKSALSFQGRRPIYQLTDSLGFPLAEEDLYTPHYREICNHCASRLTCNGCSDCGACERSK